MMLFKDIKPGNMLYILSKDGSVTVKQCKVKTAERSKEQSPSIGIGNMVNNIDITVEHDGKLTTYTTQENLSKCYAGTSVISTNKEDVVDELEKIKDESEDAIRNHEIHEVRIKECDELIEQYNPIAAKNKEQEKRLDSIEKDMKDLKSILSKIAERL